MPKPKGSGKYGRPLYNQASKVIQKFGNEILLADLLGISPVTVYRWQYARPYGTDGLVPSSNTERIMLLAREHGILITPQDWVPERIDYSALEDKRLRVSKSL